MNVVHLSGLVTIADNDLLFEQLLQEQSECQESWYLRLASRLDHPGSGVHTRYGVLCVTVDSVSVPVVPRGSEQLRQLILRELHAGVLGGHVGTRKLLKLVQARFYWKGMAGDIERFVAACSVCQAHKTSTQSPAGLLQPLPPPTGPFVELTMDFIPQLPVSSRGYDCILTIVDRFSKYVVLVPCHTTSTAEDVATLFFERVVCCFGMPSKIVCDRDPKYMSRFW